MRGTEGAGAVFVAAVAGCSGRSSSGQCGFERGCVCVNLVRCESFVCIVNLVTCAINLL
jgi:hypothetical protein